MKTKTALLASIMVVMSFCPNLHGQLFKDRQKVNVEFIPKTAFAAAAVFPKPFAEDPKFDLFPREFVTAWGVKELGFDPMLVKQATFIVKRMDGLGQPPQWAGVLHFDQMQGLAGNLIDRLESKRVGGKAMFSGAAVGMPSFLVYDESTIFIGDESFFQDMVAADGTGNLVRLIKGASVKGQAIAVADIESVRPFLNQALAMLPRGLPPAINKLKSVPDQIVAMELGVNVEKSLKTTLVIHAEDEEKAEEVNKIVNNAMEFGSDMMIGMMAAQMDFNDPVQEALVEYTQRMSQDYRARMAPSVSGREMTVNLGQEATALPIAVGLLLPAVQSARSAARRAQSMNNKKQMVLAMHNYLSAHGAFPAQASYDKNGKPLLSWRVHMLPYMEQQELYEKFHLDEPWDSPHNKQLIKEMPLIYQSPAVAYIGDGKTVYLGVAGEGMAFSNTGRKINDYTDGTSNTILTVEANDDQAVIWTKPQDWDFDANDPLKGLGRTQPGGIVASMADGSVHVISPAIDPNVWKSLLTIGGGEIVSSEDF